MQTPDIIFWSFFLLIFYTYLGYGILLWFLVKVKELFKKPSLPPYPDPLPCVTLLIAAYNEESIIDEKIANCRALNYPKDKLQVAFVTDGSTDATNERLACYPEVTVWFDPNRGGKTAALNRSVPFVKNPITVFTDANTMLNPDAIREIVRRFEDPKVGCVAGEKRIEVLDEDGSASAGEGIYWRYESKLKEWDDRLYSVVGAAGELFSVRTELFEYMENDTLLDDFILSLRINQKGYKTAYCANAYAVERGSADMKEEAKRKVRIAAGGLQSIYRLGSLLNIFRYGVLSFQYVSHRVLRWTITPILFFALFPINIWLLASDCTQWIYWVTWIGQILFYIAGYCGYLLSRKEIKNKYLYVPYYFLFMNINVFKGIAYLRKKRGTGAWEKANRAK